MSGKTLLADSVFPSAPLGHFILKNKCDAPS